MTANTDVSAGVEGVSTHGVGDPVLENHAEEFVLVLPSQRLDEHVGHPLDHSAPPGSRRAVAEPEEWFLSLRALGVGFGQQEPFVF